jgi:hypothetical protein
VPNFRFTAHLLLKQFPPCVILRRRGFVEQRRQFEGDQIVVGVKTVSKPERRDLATDGAQMNTDQRRELLRISSVANRF